MTLGRPNEFAHFRQASLNMRQEASKQEQTLPQTKWGLLKKKVTPNPPIIGKDGPDGRWYIRIPLWAQTTVLILFIGLLSISLLVLVSAIQVWNYSEQLMRERLSTSTGMVTIVLEQASIKAASVIQLVASWPLIYQFIEAANSRTLNSTAWLATMNGLGQELSLVSSVRSAVFYDNYISPVYVFNQGPSTTGIRTTLLSQNFFPLSDPKLRQECMETLSNTTGSLMATKVITNNETVTISVTHGVSAYPYFDNVEPNFYSQQEEISWIGYVTFVLDLEISVNVFPEGTLRNYMINIVREDDIQNASSEDPSFRFLFPYLSQNAFFSAGYDFTFNQFPVVRNALSLLFNSSAKAVETISPQEIPDVNTEVPKPNGFSYATYTLNSSYPLNITNPVNSSYPENSTASTNSSNTTSLRNLTANSSGSVIPSVSKHVQCNMRTRIPDNLKSSVCYTYANMLNQRWLVFVAIPESDAFIEVRNVRNIVVGVGVGILGAVLVMVLPLSIWQTRGLYIIYQNMKLRPMFIVDKNLPTDPPDKHQGNSISPGSVDHTSGEEKSDKSKSSKNIDTSSSRGSATIENEFQEINKNLTAHESISSVQSDTHYQFTVPLPLPNLNRWYTDETDDLVDAYNNLAEKLNGQYFHLEDKVKSRTKEAQKARELREQANAAKSEFIAIISHELRTPLNGIMGLTAVSVDEQDSEKVRSALCIIIESGHVLMGLLNELLQLSKSLVGVDPVVQEFSVSKLVQMLPNMFLTRASALSVTFGFSAVPKQLSSVVLKGDLDHTVQICLNFMSNAMKFSEKNGKVSVIMHLRPFSDSHINIEPYGDSLRNSNSILEILVTDAGFGISPAQLARIFDLFVQGEDPLRKNQKGAGLGMAMSKQLAEGIGGYVTVYSAKDVGSSAVLRVPVEAIDLTDEEISSLNGPPIEFKVNNVYTTDSLNAGKVTMVEPKKSIDQTIEPTNTHSNDSDTQIPFGTTSTSRRFRHSHHSSTSSKLILVKNSPVVRLLRPHNHGTHQAENAQLPNVGQPYGADNRDSSLPSLTLETSNGPQNSHRVYAGQSSASALLSHVPENLFDTKNNVSSSHQYLVSSEADNAVQKPPPSSPKRPSNLVIPSRGFAKLTSSPTSNTPDIYSAPGSVASGDSSMVLLSPIDTSFFPKIELGTGMRILLAEDNKLNQTIMVKMLNQLGFKSVDAVEDGDAVIKKVEESIVGGYHYAVIFMDLSMPGTNGIDATHHIRGTLGYPYPIIALTGFSDTQTRNACMAVNIQEVLTKPVMKHDIIRILQKYSTLE